MPRKQLRQRENTKKNIDKGGWKKDEKITINVNESLLKNHLNDISHHFKIPKGYRIKINHQQILYINKLKDDIRYINLSQRYKQHYDNNIIFIKPDGGVFTMDIFLNDETIKKDLIILVTEDKRQGTNKERKKEGVVSSSCNGSKLKKMILFFDPENFDNKKKYNYKELNKLLDNYQYEDILIFFSQKNNYKKVLKKILDNNNKIKEEYENVQYIKKLLIQMFNLDKKLNIKKYIDELNGELQKILSYNNYDIKCLDPEEIDEIFKQAKGNAIERAWKNICVIRNSYMLNEVILPYILFLRGEDFDFESSIHHRITYGNNLRESYFYPDDKNNEESYNILDRDSCISYIKKDNTKWTEEEKIYVCIKVIKQSISYYIKKIIYKDEKILQCCDHLIKSRDTKNIKL